MVGLVIVIFILGYLAIVAEHFIKINKAAVAIVTGVLCWTVYILISPEKQLVGGELAHHFGDISEILFFLLGAMTIVEIIDSHDGFDLVSTRLNQTDKRKLLWTVAFITFFLSAILDNLTTTIVIISLLRKLIRDAEDRLFFAGIVVIAANAGGAWSPIGDVTTTMLWIGGQITSGKIIIKLILPSLMALTVPLVYLSFRLRGKIERPVHKANPNNQKLSKNHQSIVFFSGVLILILVPVFKAVTHLPPFMGILMGLGIIWIITEILHGRKKEEDKHIYQYLMHFAKLMFQVLCFFLVFY